jgi:23S rRNA pseudouridine2605 synthase
MHEKRKEKPVKKLLRKRKSKPSNVKVTQPRKLVSESDDIRLNKYISNCGVCSRREADNLISEGRVEVNGKKIDALGTRINKSDTVMLDGNLLSISEKFYVLLNKPKDHITTTNDPQGRKTVMDLIQDSSIDRLYPVGRLDRNTTGVLLFTNDGLLAQRLIHPSRRIKKIYAADLDRPLTKADHDKLLSGVSLEDGIMKADKVAYVDPKDATKIGIEIHSGKNRIIHRTFEALGYKVKQLDRVIFAGLDKQKLQRGKWRILTEKELNQLKSVAGMA